MPHLQGYSSFVLWAEPTISVQNVLSHTACVSNKAMVKKVSTLMLSFDSLLRWEKLNKKELL